MGKNSRPLALGLGLGLTLCVTAACTQTGEADDHSAALKLEAAGGSLVAEKQHAVEPAFAREQLPQTIEHGTIEFRTENRQQGAKLPLYCIEAEYGVDWPSPPSITPSAPLQSVRFDVPADQQGKLAAFWLNLGDGEHGVLIIGPKGWKAVSAGVGANGSVGILLRNPGDEKQTLQYSDSGGCQGCSIANVGTYFPSLGKWAEEQDFPGEKKEFLQQTLLTPNIVAYSLKHPDAGYETHGVAYQQHGGGGAVFRMEEISLTADSRPLATTILNFFVAQAKQPTADW
jgi:hypothetical protein